MLKRIQKKKKIQEKTKFIQKLLILIQMNAYRVEDVEYFNLSSNDLKIHCNLCCKFFHCKIAGKCDGDNCKIEKPNGEIHRASYCYDCAGLISKNKILCKDCLLDTHLEKTL